MAINQICGGGGYLGGDFYVYYILDKNNEYKIPRIAIRLEGHNEIGEIRGIEENQNLEEEMIVLIQMMNMDMSYKMLKKFINNFK